MSAQRHQNRMQQHFREEDGVDSSFVSRCCDFSEHTIRESPLVSMLTAFGVGLGLGAAIGSLLADPLGLSRRRTAETLGRRMLDSIADVLPNSVRHHVHS